MINILASGKRVINIDETWLSETSFIRKTWGEKNGNGNMTLNSVIPRVSVIAALDTEGNIWFTLSHANTDSNMMALFFQYLTQALDTEVPGW